MRYRGAAGHPPHPHRGELHDNCWPPVLPLAVSWPSQHPSAAAASSAPAPLAFLHAALGDWVALPSLDALDREHCALAEAGPPEPLRSLASAPARLRRGAAGVVEPGAPTTPAAAPLATSPPCCSGAATAWCCRRPAGGVAAVAPRVAGQAVPTGHFMVEERPDEVLAEIQEHLAAAARD
ncbi:hypothetical protein QJS66_13830 [Kocuria rhizophila]|nr:hypothetical protein QJS66_13830 [Kocuria rhizophila]